MALGTDHRLAVRAATWSRWRPMTLLRAAPLLLLVSLASASFLGRAEARVLRAHTIDVRTISGAADLQWFAQHYDVALLYEVPLSKGYLQAQLLHQYNPSIKVVGYKDSHALLPGQTGWSDYNGNHPGIQTQLAAAIGSSDLTIQLVDASAFPTSGFWIKIGSETIEIASRSGNTLTVKNYGSGNTGRGIATVRVADGGNWAATSHPAGATVYRPREDFFLHDETTGSRLYYSKYGWYHMDVSSPSFQDSWSQEALTWITTYYNVSTSGLDPAGPHFDGLFADDCWIDIAYAQNTERMTRVKDDQFGRIPQAKVNSFHDDMLDHIGHMKQVLGSRILIVNSGGGVSQDYAEAADGVMHEQWMHAAWWNASTDPRESNWLENISSMQTLSAKGKYYLAQDNLNYSGLPAGRDEQVFRFAFASYLLATNSVYPDQTKTSLRHRPYLDTSKTAYYTGYWYGIYDLDPGTPLGPYYVYYQDKTKGITVYARDYANAIALVNPSSENNFASSALDATVSLPGQFNEIRPDGTLGPVVSSIAVKNKSGAVVARTTPVGAPIVSLQQTIDKPAAPPGDIVTYTFVYKNVGSVSAKSFAITDVLPAQVAFVGGSATLNGVVVTPDPVSTDGTIVQMPIGEVAAGQQGTFTFQVQVK